MKNKYSYIFLFFLVSLHFLWGQKPTVIDSLESVFKTINQDTAKIHLLNSLAKEYQNTEPEKAMQYARQALQIAENLLPLKNVEDQVKEQHIENRIKKGMADAMYIIGQINDERGDYESSLRNYLKALDIRQNIGDIKGVAYAYNAIGLMYKEQGKFEDALKMNIKSLEMKKSIGDKKGIANSYRNIGKVYEVQGDFAEALKMHFNALAIDKQVGNKKGIAYGYTNIAIIYKQQTHYEDALKMDLEAILLLEEINDKMGILRTYNDIGVIYKSQKKYDDALKYYFKSLRMAEEMRSSYYIGGVYLNLGNIYSEMNDYKEAINYHLKGLKLMREVGNKHGIINALIDMGNLYAKQEKYELSLPYYNEAITLSKAIGVKSLTKECYSGLAEAYSKMNNYQKAFEYKELYTQISDSILNEASIKQINEMKTKYETEKREKEIELLNKDNMLKETHFQGELKQQTTLRNFFIGGFLLVLLLAFVSIVGYRQKIRSNTLIASKNEEISKQKASIAGQEEERKRIAKELHDGIGGTLAVIKLNLMRINSSSNNISELESVITDIGETCKEIRTISHNLAPPALSNTFLIETMKDAIVKFVVPGKTDICFEYSPEEELDNIPLNIHADIYRITQELLHNIVKHAHASKVEIDLSKEGDYLYLLVEDNGIGFDITTIPKGIGLKNIESRVNLLNGKMTIDSKTGRGTAINIHIPLIDKLTNTIFT